ncbi:hypothetical protein JCM10450v2_003588 [Rhodotorula kratochvilovae]
MSDKVVDASTAPASAANALPPLDLLSLAKKEAASWNSLPVELKRKIIDDVYTLHIEDWSDLDEEAHAFGWFAGRRSWPVYKPVREELCDLQVVNSEFCELVTPYLWRAVLITKTGTDGLSRLIDVLARHGEHVRELNFGDVGGIAFGTRETSDTVEREKARLAVLAVSPCRNIEEVTLIMPEPWFLDMLHLPLLRTLNLMAATYSLADHTFLLGQSALTSLSIYAIQRLAPFLAGMPSLKHLRLEGGHVVNDYVLALGGAKGQAPLESLELVVTEDEVSFGVLHEFVTAFAATLKTLHLELFTGDNDEIDVPSHPDFDLPALTALSIGSDYASAFFLRLASPSIPIANLRLGLNPYIREGEPDDLLAFLRAHASTLKTVELTSEALYGAEKYGPNYPMTHLDELDVRAIASCCAELGLQVLGDFDDVTDESQDYEEEDPYDGDGYGVEDDDDEEEEGTTEEEEGTTEEEDDDEEDDDEEEWSE